MKVFKLNQALKGLRKINDEIRYRNLINEEKFTSGLIAFQPKKNSDPKQISHDDQDVVCHVLKGTGRLRMKGKKTPLKPGTICHIPRGTPHDFAAGTSGELVLFYSLIKTA
jgi:quercetin dioxygenase-like cupin family protein